MPRALRAFSSPPSEAYPFGHFVWDMPNHAFMSASTYKRSPGLGRGFFTSGSSLKRAQSRSISSSARTRGGVDSAVALKVPVAPANRFSPPVTSPVPNTVKNVPWGLVQK